MEAFCAAATADELIDSMLRGAATQSDVDGAQPAQREGAAMRTPPRSGASALSAGDGALADLEAFLASMTPLSSPAAT